MNKIKITLISAVLSFLIFTDMASATVADLSITPENPVRGDKVILHGNAQPGEKVRVEIFFQKNVTVQNGKYLFPLDNVKIPEEKNKFTVVARGCDNLKVSVKVFLIWLTISSEAVNNTAKVSRSAPAGTYDILIHGDSREDFVTLEITATAYINADENGEFDFTYDTSSIPAGEFTISAGNITRNIVLREPKFTPPFESREGGGSVSAGTPIRTYVTPAQNNSAQNLTKNNSAYVSQRPNQTPVVTTQSQSSHKIQNLTEKIPDTLSPDQNAQITTNESEIEGNLSEYGHSVSGFGFIEALTAIFSMLLVFRNIIS